MKEFWRMYWPIAVLAAGLTFFCVGISLKAGIDVGSMIFGAVVALCGVMACAVHYD